MDEATAALVIQLQIEDSEELSSLCKGKGKAKEGDISDSQIAFELYQEDLERNASVIKDRQMTKSIAQACQTDGDMLAASLSEEQTAANDHEAACRLGGVAIPLTIEPWTITAEEMDEELLAKLSALYVSVPEEVQDVDGKCEEAESSTWAAGRTALRAADRRCTACQEEVRFFDIARVPCGHEYCRDCLRGLYQASMTDDSLFPPRCCRQPITSGSVRIFLTSDLVRQYEEKKIEHDTPNRTYCSNPSCSSFIRLEGITNDRATCLDCGTITCTMCKAVDHTGDCPADSALQLVLQTATENGWQRCYSCRRLVELDVGCNHITFVHTSLLQVTVTNCIDATAEPNSATSAGNVGKPVPVPNGMRIDSLAAHAKSWHDNQSKRIFPQPKPRSRQQYRT